jgi:hypothetical protein
MSFLNANKYQDRQSAAANARKALAEKFLSQPKYDPNDPAVLKREAERRAILEAREQRERERQQRKLELEALEAAKRAEEEAARAEQMRLEALNREEEEKKKKEEVERLAFEAKLDRDARYAARKERKKKRLSAFERFGLK